MEAKRKAENDHDFVVSTHFYQRSGQELLVTLTWVWMFLLSFTPSWMILKDGLTQWKGDRVIVVLLVMSVGIIGMAGTVLFLNLRPHRFILANGILQIPHGTSSKRVALDQIRGIFVIQDSSPKKPRDITISFVDQGSGYLLTKEMALVDKRDVVEKLRPLAAEGRFDLRTDLDQDAYLDLLLTPAFETFPPSGGHVRIYGPLIPDPRDFMTDIRAWMKREGFTITRERDKQITTKLKIETMWLEMWLEINIVVSGEKAAFQIKASGMDPFDRDWVGIVPKRRARELLARFDTVVGDRYPRLS